MKIKIHDNEERFVDFEMEGDRSVDIEEALMDWFLENSDLESTIEMIEEKMDVKITVIDDTELEED